MQDCEVNMEVKSVVKLYVKHQCSEATVRQEFEFDYEPSHSDIKKCVDSFEPATYDFEIDYSTGAVVLDCNMPKKSKIESVYATIEKRFYK